MDKTRSSRSMRRFLSLAVGAVAAVTAALTALGAEAATRAEIERLVVAEAQRTTVPPSLALAVARVESNFQDQALSSAGARGVMQIMPKTARDLYGVNADRLWNARLNVRIGIDYLASLIERYNGRWDLALSHYNGGSAVGKPPRAKVIPATRKYVNDVLSWQRRYERKATALAMADAVDRRQPGARTVTDRVTGYWMFDDPTVAKDWRHYLRVADYWLQPPEKRQAIAAAKVPEAAPRAEEAGQWKGYVGEPTQPSHRLRQRIEEGRARFREHLATGSRPWQPIRGRPVAG